MSYVVVSILLRSSLVISSSLVTNHHLFLVMQVISMPASSLFFLYHSPILGILWASHQAFVKDHFGVLY